MGIFGKSAKKPPVIQSLIGSELSIKGDIEFEGGLRIDGEIFGSVKAKPGSNSILVVSETGKVRGEVNVCHVVVSGQIIGPLVANDLLELHPSAIVSGDVKYQSLQMHPGAVVHGTLHHKTESELEPDQTGLLALAPEAKQA